MGIKEAIHRRTETKLYINKTKGHAAVQVPDIHHRKTKATFVLVHRSNNLNQWNKTNTNSTKTSIHSTIRQKDKKKDHNHFIKTRIPATICPITRPTGSNFPFLHLHTVRRTSFNFLSTYFFPVCRQHGSTWFHLQ